MHQVARIRLGRAILAAGLAMSAGAAAVLAQDAAAAGAKQTYTKVIGAVVSVAPDGSKLTVQPDGGAPAEVLLDSNTSYMLVPPGEKDLRKATRIELKDIQAGDRVYARSRKVDGQDQTAAASVFVMSKTEVAQHQEKKAAEWQRRGAAGKVTAVDAAAKTVTISVQAAGGPKSLVVATDDKTAFRRYAPDSVKFADAQPSDFATIAVGNNVRVLGDKDADGATIHAEQLVSGSFRNLAGTVISVDAAANEIKVTDLQTKKPVTVKVNADTNLRTLPPQAAMMLARMRGGAAGNAGAPGDKAGQPRVQGGPDSHPGFNGPAAPAGSGSAQGGAPSGQDAAAGGRGSWQAGGDHPAGSGGAGGGRMDMNQVLERAPQMTLGELKPGAALIISSTNGADPARVTAIAVVAGVEPLLAAAPPSSRQSGGTGNAAWNLDIGMPE